MEVQLINPEMPRAFNGSYDIIKQILINRGIREEPEEFFSLSWEDVQSPYDLDYIGAAAQRILTSVELDEKIAILVDSDTDGLSSSVILTNYLRRLNKDIKLTHLFHETKKHGLNDTKIMKRLRDKVQPDLLIIPDASGTEQQYNALVDLGINIIVADHHPDTYEPIEGDRRVIIVNNQQSNKYLNKALSGVGIVWQLLRVLDDITQNDWANEWLDLVALGLVADVMDLRSRETRFLIQEGLKPQNLRNPFMLQYAITNIFLMKTIEYNPKKIGWNLAPVINAVIRVGTSKENELLFNAMLEGANKIMVENGKRGHAGEKISLVEEAIRQATNAKSRQTRHQGKLIKIVENYIHENNLINDKIIFVKIDEFDTEERALSGVVANKLLDIYRRPILLGYKSDKDSSLYEGSLRVPSDIPCFQNFKTQCEESGLFEFLAGHENAAGHACFEEKINEIIKYFNSKYENQPKIQIFNVDYLFEADDPNLVDTILAIDEYRNWYGHGFEEPLIGIKNANCSIYDIELMSGQKNPTLKFRLKSGVAAIRFHSSQAEYDSFTQKNNILMDENISHNFTLIGEASINIWRDTITPQLLIKEYEHCGYNYTY